MWDRLRKWEYTRWLQAGSALQIQERFQGPERCSYNLTPGREEWEAQNPVAGGERRAQPECSVDLAVASGRTQDRWFEPQECSWNETF